MLAPEFLALKHESRILVQPCIWFKEVPSQFTMGQTAESNLFHHGETIYRVGWMSENPTPMLTSKELWLAPCRDERGVLCVYNLLTMRERWWENGRTDGRRFPILFLERVFVFQVQKILGHRQTSAWSLIASTHTGIGWPRDLRDFWGGILVNLKDFHIQ